MIEINLIPDVKKELLKAQRVRSTVISMAVIVGIGAIALVVVLCIWVFGVQIARSAITDNIIKTQSQKLASVSDISNTLTIQNQLSLLTKMHASKHIDSRAFDVLTTINPPQPNDVAINKMTLDSTSNTITLSAQAANGYPALEVFKKTIEATTFKYTQDGQNQSVPLASGMSDSDRSYGEDVTGAKVLRFTLVFTYPDVLFAPNLSNARIVAPTKANATDSYLGVPKSLFIQKASDTAGGAQ
jgi:hypothetical protein